MPNIEKHKSLIFLNHGHTSRQRLTYIKDMSTPYTRSIIDDILLPARIASWVAFISKCYLDYQSEHMPLYTAITPDILSCQIHRPWMT